MAITGRGRLDLFNHGWASRINEMWLYNSSSVAVASMPCSFTYNSSTKKLELSSSVTFDIDNGDNIAYVGVGWKSPEPFPLYNEYDRKALSQIYTFSSDGTLTINTLTFTATSTYLTDYGVQSLFTTGIASKITFANSCNVGNTILNTQSVTFTASETDLELNSPIVFSISAGGKPQYIHLGFNDSGTSRYVYKRTHTEYNYLTNGLFTINTWSITV